MKLTKEELYHGMPVVCTINGNIIKDAKISINSNLSIYICQNVVDGFMCEDKLGYDYSYLYYDSSYQSYSTGVSVLKAGKSRVIKDGLIQGDIIFNKTMDIERKILGVCGDVIFVGSDNFMEVVGYFTLPDLIKDGWKLKGENDLLPEQDIKIREIVNEIKVYSFDRAVDILKTFIASYSKDYEE